MKLLFCIECLDIFSLHENRLKTCSCGIVKGIATDPTNIEITNGVVLGIDNRTFTTAITMTKDANRGKDFNAFVISNSSPTITRK